MHFYCKRTWYKLTDLNLNSCVLFKYMLFSWNFTFLDTRYPLRNLLLFLFFYWGGGYRLSSGTFRHVLGIGLIEDEFSGRIVSLLEYKSSKKGINMMMNLSKKKFPRLDFQFLIKTSDLLSWKLLFLIGWCRFDKTVIFHSGVTNQYSFMESSGFKR